MQSASMKLALPTMLRTLDRAYDGPVVEPLAWDTKVIYQNIKSKLTEHGLSGLFDEDNPIPSDDKLADEFFVAGRELALETGMLCLDTKRVIRISEDELKQTITDAPKELMIGEGSDAFLHHHRMPDDRRPPKLCAPLGIVVSEDLWVRLHVAIFRLSEVDYTEGASLATAYGREVRSGTPLETLVGRLHAEMHREAKWRAGRPGMAAIASISSVTALANLGGFGIPGGFDARTDIAMNLSPAELKTSFHSLNKIVQAVNCGARIYSGTESFIGGYAGPTEGAAIALIANSLLHMTVHSADITSDSIMDLSYNGTCGRAGLWATSIAHQAISRNAPHINNCVANQTAGPATAMLLYESAAGMLTICVSGGSQALVSRSAGGKYPNHISPLEIKFCGEVLKKCAGLKRSDANEIVKSILPKYEHQLGNPPIGKPFQECFDVNTGAPSEEWLQIYKDIKKEMIDLGIPLAG
jgi:methylamine--corrinoid protein Co-methyltransferase